MPPAPRQHRHHLARAAASARRTRPSDRPASSSATRRVGDQPAAADDDEMVGGVLASRSSGGSTRARRGPRRRATAGSSRIQPMPSGSRPLTGSSKSSTGGSPSSAAAMPEPLRHAEREPAGLRRATLVRPTSSSTASTRRRGRPCRLRQPEQVVARAPAGMDRAVRRAARRPAAAGSASVRVAAGRRRARSRRRRERPGRGSCRIVVDLPAPFGPDEAGHPPGLDGERQAVDRDRAPVPLRAAPSHLDRRVHAADGRSGARRRSSRPGAIFRAPPRRWRHRPASPLAR